MSSIICRLYPAMDLRRGFNRLIKVAHLTSTSFGNQHNNGRCKVLLKNFSVIRGTTPLFSQVTRNSKVRRSVGCCYYSRSNVKPEDIKDNAATPSSETTEVETKELPNENMFTIPNILCMARIGMSPIIASMIIHSQYEPAIGLVAVAGVTDLLDGWIARVVPGQSTVMGSFLDPLADKILVGTLFLSLSYMGLIPLPLTALIVGRDVILIAFGFYVRYISLDPPKTFTRYFNVTLPTAQLAPTFLSKVNTGLQLVVVGATLASTVITSVDLHPYLEALWYTTAATTIASAVGYCFAKNTVKMLRETSAKIKANKAKSQQS